MTVQLAFAESVAQWQVLRAHGGDALQIIPVTPAVDDQAARTGEPYHTVEDLCDHDTLMQLGDRNIVICEQFCDDLDAWLRTVAAGQPRQEWVSAGAFFHPMKGLLDSLTRRSLPVMNAIDTLAPDSVVCFQLPPYAVSGLSLLDKPALSMTTRIAALAAAARGLEIHWLPEPAHGGEEPEEPAVALPMPVSPPRYEAGAGWPQDGQALLVHSLFADVGTGILEAWHGGGMGTHLCFGNVFPEPEVAARRPACQQLGALLWQHVREDPTIRRHFCVRDVDLFPLVESTLRRICEEGVPDLLAFAPVAERAVANLERAVLATGGMMDRNAVLGKAAHAAGIPMVSIHYGGFLGYSLLPMHERYDLANADYFATGGEGAARTFAQPSSYASWRPERRRARPVPLGAPWVEEIVAAERPRGGGEATGRRIMYVMSALLGDNAYLGYAFHPEIWYHRFQRRLIEALSRFPDCHVLLKPPLGDRYPQIDNPIFGWLEEQGYGNIEVMGNVPLADVLGEADAFIVDSPSTPLLQLVATDKPFLVYADRDYFKFQADAAALLAKRAIYSNTLEGFFEALDRFLAWPDWTLARPVNDEFLAAYATGGTDGRAAERVAGFLHRVALGMGTDAEQTSELPFRATTTAATSGGVTDVAHQR
ncbi:MAG: hypothetical protein ACYTFN_21930 [Planctomycetota bacterium]|jgi:hypothetical protein